MTGSARSWQSFAHRRAGQSPACPAGSPAAADDPRRMIVAIDHDAYRLRDARFRIDALQSGIREALSRHDDIAIRTALDGLLVIVDHPERHEPFLTAVSQWFAGEPGYTVDLRNAETIRIMRTPLALQGMAEAERERAAHALDIFVRQLRPPLSGVRVDAGVHAAIVSADDPALGTTLRAVLDRRYGDLYLMAPITECSWRVAPNPQCSRLTTAAYRQWAATTIAPALDLELRDPIDLDTRRTAAGIELVLPDPERHARFRDGITARFAADVDYESAVSPALFLKARWTGAIGPGDNAEYPGFERVVDAAYEVQQCADPPVVFTACGNGFTVRAVDPLRTADRVAIIRGMLAGRSDLIVTTRPDQSLAIAFALPPALSTRVAIDGDRRIGAVLARARALELPPPAVTVIDDDRLELCWATPAAALRFRRALAGRFGFALRMVAEDGDPPVAASAQAPGDERARQAQGRENLWLQPGTIVSGDMITEAITIRDPYSDGWNVEFRLTGEGRQRLAAATGANIRRRLAIVLDGVILSAPHIGRQLTGGVVHITPHHSTEAANALVQALLAYRDDVPLRCIA